VLLRVGHVLFLGTFEIRDEENTFKRKMKEGNQNEDGGNCLLPKAFDLYMYTYNTVCIKLNLKIVLIE
jgi:hypothetical protein